MAGFALSTEAPCEMALEKLTMPTCSKCGFGYMEGESHQCVMEAHQRVGNGIGTAGLVLGGVFGGPLVLSILTVIYYRALDPETLADGQFVLVFVTALPLGALLGALAGVCMSKWRRGERREASQISVAGGIGILTLSVAIAIGSAETRGGNLQEFMDTIRSGWIAPAVIGATGFVVGGIVSWRRLRPV